MMLSIWAQHSIVSLPNIDLVAWVRSFTEQYMFGLEFTAQASPAQN